jgi:hypothetical protein
MTGSAICDFSLLTSQFLLLTFLTSAVGYFRLKDSLLNSEIRPLTARLPLISVKVRGSNGAFTL